MESETTEINYWQRARINLNLAKSRQLRVHAEKRRLGRCRFMHMPRRRRLRDWDKITSGSTRSAYLAHEHPPPHPPSPSSGENHHFHSQTTPTERSYPSLSIVAVRPRPRLHRRHTHLVVVCIFEPITRGRVLDYTLPLGPRHVRVCTLWAADKSSVLMCAPKRISVHVRV